MQDIEIRKYIDRLNKSKARESIFIRRISNIVDFAIVWPAQPKIADSTRDLNPYSFFFIRNNLDTYVGAVCYMGNDLHWYVLPKYRRAGHLTNALKASILPYLFYKVEKVRITINRNAIGERNYFNSKSVAINVGFRPVNDKETIFVLNKSDFNWDCENLSRINSGMNLERFNVLRKRLFYAYKIIDKTSDELLLTVIDEKKINEITAEIRRFCEKIHTKFNSCDVDDYGIPFDESRSTNDNSNVDRDT